MKKAMLILLCAVMLMTALSLPAIAAEGEQPANETEQTADEAVLPEPAAQSAVETEPTVPPADEPVQTAAPTSAPEPTAAPTDEPEQTAAPTDPPASPTPDASLLTGAETSARSPAMSQAVSQLQKQMAWQSAIDSYKEQIESLQEEMSMIWDEMIVPLRDLVIGSREDYTLGRALPPIPDEIIAYMEEHGVPYFIPGQYEEGENEHVNYPEKTMFSLMNYHLSLGAEVSDLIKKMSEPVYAFDSVLQGGSLFSTGGATATGAYALTALSAFVGGAGGSALTWAIINRKKKDDKGDGKK